MPSRRSALRIGIVILVLLGLTVRCRHYLAAPSYWYDEAYVLVNVFDKSFAELAGPLRCEQAAPPLFLWSLRVFHLVFGRSEWALRFPAFVASVLAVLAMIPLARRIAPGAGRLWAIGFAAVSQPAIFHTVCVKPYAGDLLATVLVTLCGVLVLERSSHRRWLALLTCAVVMPWYSYPSIFALGGVTIALAMRRVARVAGSRRRTASTHAMSGSDSPLLMGAFTALWITSFLMVWLLIGRHQRTGFLAAYWRPFFLDANAPLSWIIGRLVKLGSYGTTGMGVLLLPLAAGGAWRLRHQSILLFAPIVLMFAANAARFYPLEDRLFFFALPWLWLLAAAGIEAVTESARGRWRKVAMLSALLLLIPGMVRYAYWVAVVPSKVEFREAFEHVRAREQPGDGWWVSHPEVAEAYFGKAVPAAHGQRIWLILARGADDGDITRPLLAAGFRSAEISELRTVSVRLFIRSPND